MGSSSLRHVGNGVSSSGVWWLSLHMHGRGTSLRIAPMEDEGYGSWGVAR